MRSIVKTLRGHEQIEDVSITPAGLPTHTPADPTDDVNEPKKSIDHIHARELAAEYVEGSEAEKRLLRKLDFRLIVSLVLASNWKDLTLITRAAMLLDSVTTWLPGSIKHWVSVSSL